MAVPLIPFVAGAVVGGLVAYFYKDETVRREVRRAADEVSDVVSHNLDELRHRIRPDSGKTEKEPPVVAKKATSTTTKKKKTKKKKKASAKKKVAKKRSSTGRRTAKKTAGTKKKASRGTSANDKPESP